MPIWESWMKSDTLLLLCCLILAENSERRAPSQFCFSLQNRWEALWGGLMFPTPKESYLTATYSSLQVLPFFSLPFLFFGGSNKFKNESKQSAKSGCSARNSFTNFFLFPGGINTHRALPNKAKGNRSHRAHDGRQQDLNKPPIYLEVCLGWQSKLKMWLE